MKTARELAEQLIREHVKSIEFLSIAEGLPDELSEREHDELAVEVDLLIRAATITVQLPGPEPDASQHRTLTQDELMAEARKRFGQDSLDIAFQCPNCGDVAAVREFPEEERGRAGQECIGRYLGALGGGTERGCDFVAYGLIPGPWEITFPSVRSFPLADAPAVADA